MHGNVYELTRTFWDVHPKVSPKPPNRDDIANYALVAKGGSYGDRWQFLMVCARTGIIGEKGELSLRDNNRADSLGVRLARHERPGYDLLLHSIRRLSYDAAAAEWSEYVPHAFAMERMDGVDDVKVEDGPAPYVHFKSRARGIAFAPLWTTKLDEKERRDDKPARHRYFVLGAFRSDIPLSAGVCLSEAETRVLLDERDRYEKLKQAYQKMTKEQQKKVQLPKPPDAPDEYEKATTKHQAELGLWREKVVAPGEWFLVYWNGYIGLANKTLTMPPDAIVMVPEKQIARKNAQPERTQLAVDAESDGIRLRFQVWEQPTDKAKQVKLPGQENSSEWALCEAVPSLYIKGGATARPYCWDVEVAFKTVQGALKGPSWRTSAPDKPAGPAEKKPIEKPR
jgi:hypothetical protein